MTLTIKGRRGPVRGPCKTCGVPFRSYGAKFYCSQACYAASPELSARLARHREQFLKLHPRCVRPCLSCGSEVQSKRSAARAYCSNLCRRRYFAERFDRWVANPESIALPQNFDEFMLSSVLTCPVDGCGWSGMNLGNHVNFVHGIPARQFKKLCGFNISTGLVTPELSQKMSDRGQQRDLSQIKASDEAIRAGVEKRMSENYRSLEGREHRLKSDLVSGAREKLDKAAREWRLKHPGWRSRLSEKQKANHAAGRYTTDAKCSSCGSGFSANPGNIAVHGQLCRRCGDARIRQRKRHEPWQCQCPVCGITFTGTRNVARNQRKRHYDLSPKCKAGIHGRRPPHLRG